MSDPVYQLLDANARWFLVLAHPGHELRAYHFLERVCPSVAVLTDGSGSNGTPRLDDSRAVIERAGGRPAPVFGFMSDRDAYAALMAADARPFLPLLTTIAESLARARVQAVVIDAAEGYNPVHDVCHWIGRSAVAIARRLGAEIELFELDLVSRPDGTGEGIRLVLDDEAFRRKLEAVSRCDALKSEAEAAFEHYGRDAFRVEFLRRLSADALPPAASWIPFYEQVGEARVREGRYSSVLRYQAHVKPVIEWLMTLAPESHADDLCTLHE
jgi:hypothetical protein